MSSHSSCEGLGHQQGEPLAASRGQSVEERIGRLGVVPVVELGSLDQAMPLLETLMLAGLPLAEVTLRTAPGLAAIELLRSSLPDALIGAGTVRTADDTRRALDAGAQFIVSPATDVAQIELCGSSNVLVMPGTCTPTEVHTAVQAGVRLLKFFPAEAMGGVIFLRALAAPFRDVRFVPTGGITPANLADYLRIPQVFACGGSWMVAPDLLRERAFSRIGDLAREAVKVVREARSSD